ncbi:UDP-Glycosyltransferase/glycogen phosphorylase [Wilcoxina mikolae CBS 423.85]|nr:UDP-Glycosyltransferase/glycogen phosphorylase [Wilcoxina mikolae CBS 423.85]
MTDSTTPPKPATTRKSTAPTSSRPTLKARRSVRKTWSPPPRPGLNPGALSSLSIAHKEFNTQAHVSPRDGRVHISLNAVKDGHLSTILGSLTQRELAGVVEKEKEKRGDDVQTPPPKLNIVIMVIGSRGDVQPFIAIAKVLKEQWGHRVRLATHGAFREFVQGFGIEFFDVGGDPSELMAFMVKNPGLVPGVEAIKQGEIAKRREQMFEMFQGFWRACIEPSDNYRPHNSMESERSSSTHKTYEDVDEPFIADAIVANPPSFAHIHCAERLGCPLHLMFTFPYSPTQEIPHPLAFIQNSNLGSEYTNAITYPMVEMMTWQGLGDLVNRFRQKTLCLEPVATLWAPGMISRLKVPYTYMWSPALIPKPSDWGDHIDVTGFVFLDQTKDYSPPPALQKFLDAGPPPVYIGFGSIVVDDPDTLTETLFSAIKSTGVRALVSKGWGGLGGENDAPENVHMLENTPHDWLFSKVSAVVHHGGAGTTAIGLFHGKPTMVVPFFGDQTFWGSMIHNANAGPAPVPHKELTAENLADGIKMLLSEECQKAAQEISRKIKEEDGDGAENAVRSFYKGLAEMDAKGKRGLGGRGKTYGEGGPMGPGEGKWGTGGPGIRCDILEEKVAVWRVRKTRMRLSAMAASWLVEQGLLEWKDLRLLRHTEWNDFDGPGEPLSGGFSAFFGSIAGVAKGVIGVPLALVRGAKRIDDEVDMTPSATRRRFRDRFLRHKKPDPESSDWASSRSSSPSPNHNHNHRTIPRDIAHGTKKSLTRIARSSARAPMDVSLAIAQGFHNAPRLYGDEVRRPARITGFHSGMQAAGKEFALGIYDGFTGLVTQPYKGAKEEGVKGALKGVGKGVGGVFFKTQAGVAGVIGFSMKGVHREFRKGRDRKVLGRVMVARRMQGDKELVRAREEGETVLAQRMQEGWQKVAEERQKRTDREKSLGKEIAGLKIRKRGRKRTMEGGGEKKKVVSNVDPDEAGKGCELGVVEGDQVAPLRVDTLSPVKEEESESRSAMGKRRATTMT